jgi:DNA-binding transcriptional ArsR family regulator
MNPTTFSALAEPHRLQIVELLRDGPQPVGEIVKRLHLKQPQVSKHLRVLADAGLVEVHPFAQQRIYKLQPKPLKELDRWLQSYRQLWEEPFDRLDSGKLAQYKDVTEFKSKDHRVLTSQMLGDSTWIYFARAKPFPKP